MDQISLDRIATLHPTVRDKFKAFFDHLHVVSHYKWRVVQAFRTFEEQKKLHDNYINAPGRAAKAAPAGLSYHNYGMAIDVLPMTDDYKAIETISQGSWEMVGIVARHHGMKWGGDFGDRPHVEMHPNGNTIKTLLKWHIAGKFIKGTPYLDLPPF